MANMEAGPELEEIGRLLAEDVQGDPEGAFLYADFGDGWVGPSIFREEDDRVVLREPSDDLMWKLMDLWEAEEPDKRWTSMKYEIKDGRFHATFGYDEFTEETSEDVDRRAIVIQERYGDKPVDFSEA